VWTWTGTDADTKLIASWLVATLHAMNKLFYRCWAAAICVLGACIPANAECGSIPGSLPLHVRLSAFVFDGTVLRVDQVPPLMGR